MAQGRYTQVISMIKWILTSRVSKENSLLMNPEPLEPCREDVLNQLPQRMGDCVWGFGFLICEEDAPTCAAVTGYSTISLLNSEP